MESFHEVNSVVCAQHDELSYLYREWATGRDFEPNVVAIAEQRDCDPVVNELAPDFFQGFDAPATSFAAAAGLVMCCGHGCEARDLKVPACEFPGRGRVFETPDAQTW